MHTYGLYVYDIDPIIASDLADLDNVGAAGISKFLLSVSGELQELLKFRTALSRRAKEPS